MAIGSAYATAIQYRAVTGKTDTAQDADILTDLTAVSRHIEGILGRFFNVDVADVARIYIPDKTADTLSVDDLSAAPTTVEVDADDDGTYSTTLAATDFELLPLNAAKGPEAWPYNEIRMTPWGDYSYFYKGYRVRVTAKWGWPAVPEAVQRATIHLTAILRLETPRATNRIVELGEAIEASPAAQGILRNLAGQYKRWLV